MYLSKNKHLLSRALMTTVLIRVTGGLLEGLVRFIINRSPQFTPDMLNTKLWVFQVIRAILQIILIALVFLHTIRTLRRYTNLVDKDDYEEMRRLQEETFGDNLASLNAEDIGQLLQVWGVILTGAEMVYFVTGSIYRRFAALLASTILGMGQYDTYVSLYNLSHGFKYIEMLMAILMGVMVTAIFLNDRTLKIAAVAVVLLFLVAFGVVQMDSISFMGRQVGIVWTSVIFHVTETVGLFALSLHLSRNYRGL